MEQITLNLIPGGIPQICNVSQYDDGRTIRLHLKNGSLDYTLSGTETISLSVSKSDRTTYVCTVTNTSSSYVDITTVPEMCNVSGESECELTISFGNTVLGTGNFRMMVDPDAFDGDLKVKSVSGPIATFETDLAEDLIKLDVDLEPIQDLHGYDNPWPAGGGKNIAHFNTDNLDNSQQCTVTYIDDNNLSIDVMGNYARVMYAIACPENTTVTVSFKGSSTANYKKVQISSVNSWSGISWYRIINLTEQETTHSYTFTTSADSTIIYIGFYVSAGANTGTMHIKDFQIEKGSTVTSFAPYENVCPISGHDSAQLFRTGKNLFNNSLASATVNGTNIVVNEDKSVTISGTPSARVRVYLNNTDHLSFNFRTYFSCGTMPTGTRVFCSRKINGVADYPTISPRLPFQNNIEYYNFMLEINTSYDGTPFTIYPQLEVGSTATNYEPYTSDPTPITVNFGQTVYKGKLYSEQRKVLVTHVCETFDGSSDEQWVTTSSPSVRYGFRIYFQSNKKPTTKATDEMLSSTIPLHTTSEAASVDDDIITCRSTTYLHKIFYIFAPPSKISTVEELRAFLANEPETVMYPLDEPFFIDLTQIQTASIDSTPVASFETTLARPLETSEHYFSCSQAEGTPTPDNPIPITGVSEITAYRTGKNLITANVPTNREYWGTSQTDIVDAINSLPVGTYTISNKFKINELPSNGKVDHGCIYITAMVNGSQVPVTAYSVITDNSPTLGKVYSETGTFQITEVNKGKINHAYLYCDQSTTHSGTGRGKYDFYDLQLELGSTATPYEPYSGESITVSLGGTYYGGKLVQSEDGSRKIVLSYAQLVLSSANANIINRVNANKYRVFNADCGAKITGSDYTDIKCNKMSNQTGTANDNRCYINSTGDIRMNFASEYDTVADMIAAIESITVVYPLETPIEISLPDGDPLNAVVGENNVYCNTGDTALTYYYNMVADPIRIPALVGTNNVYSDAGNVDVEYYTTLDDGGDGE